MTKIPNSALIVVADGERAKLYTNSGTSNQITLSAVMNLEPKDLAKERPSGSQPEDQSPRQTGEATFAKQLAHKLDSLLQNKYQHLVLIADPHSLGEIRGVLHRETTAKLLLSINKDLTNHSLHDLTDVLMKEVSKED
jgi:protein required for attachment to host cells